MMAEHSARELEAATSSLKKWINYWLLARGFDIGANAIVDVGAGDASDILSAFRHGAMRGWQFKEAWLVDPELTVSSFAYHSLLTLRVSATEPKLVRDKIENVLQRVSRETETPRLFYCSHVVHDMDPAALQVLLDFLADHPMDIGWFVVRDIDSPIFEEQMQSEIKSRSIDEGYFASDLLELCDGASLVSVDTALVRPANSSDYLRLTPRSVHEISVTTLENRSSSYVERHILAWGLVNA